MWSMDFLLVLFFKQNPLFKISSLGSDIYIANFWLSHKSWWYPFTFPMLQEIILFVFSPTVRLKIHMTYLCKKYDNIVSSHKQSLIIRQMKTDNSLNFLVILMNKPHTLCSLVSLSALKQSFSIFWQSHSIYFCCFPFCCCQLLLHV